MSNKNANLQVVILCGGRGERLKPLTDKVPKPLIHIQGKPIIGHSIDYLKRFGIKKYIIAVGYKSDQIIKYCSEKYNDLEMPLVDSGNVDIIKRKLCP